MNDWRMDYMEKRTQNYNLEEIIERMDKKKLTFDYPIQRESGQWDKSQRSLLIDSILNGYFLPEIYIIREGTEDFTPMSVLDGKQRLTTLYEFAKDGFALSNDLDDVTIVDVSFDEDKNPVKEEKTYSIAKKKFSELDIELQKVFNKYKLEVKLLAGFSDEQIEDQFFRLNNGATFTKSQKANVKLGTELAGKIKEIEECVFFENRAVFSNLQRKRGEVTSCILQSMMLLSDFEYRSFAAGEVVRFAECLNENPDYGLIDKTKDLFNKLFCVLPPYDRETDKNCLKKIHIPILIKNLDTIKKLDVDYDLTDDQYTEFLKKWFEVWNDTSGYLEFCKQGSTGKAKVEGRIETMEKELKEYAIQLVMEKGA
ncbi:DUF262 domain-containing protein [Roseburia sp. 1XD42-69]|nr:DUF262 domain-containing protein [Roseburia sp. 1XD42-69]